MWVQTGALEWYRTALADVRFGENRKMLRLVGDLEHNMLWWQGGTAYRIPSEPSHASQPRSRSTSKRRMRRMRQS